MKEHRGSKIRTPLLVIAKLLRKTSIVHFLFRTSKVFFYVKATSSDSVKRWELTKNVQFREMEAKSFYKILL